MRTPICRTRAMRRGLGFGALVTAFISTSVSAQVNSWINPTSGSWDQASSWSLSALPGSSQSVMITNSGWKAVAINPSTPVSFPDSMTVNDLTIRGAWDTRNTLLLNFFGTGVSLTVLNGLTLQDNAQIVNFNSGLVVQGGTVTVTNAQIAQDGGLIRTTNSTMSLANSEYNLTNGVFEGGQVLLGLPVSARFSQYGGTAVIADLAFGRGPTSGAGGTYVLYGGELSLPNGLNLMGDNNASQTYFQAGGTNRTTKIFMEAGLFGGSPSFTLSDGLLAAGDVQLQGDRYGRAIIEQNGGTHIITNTLSLIGGAQNPSNVKPAEYHLSDGTLSAGSIDLSATGGNAALTQSNGVAMVGNILGHANGPFTYFVSTVTLAGGTLSCSNLHVTDGGSILQYGGMLTVSNALTVDGYREPGPKLYSGYRFSGGMLVANNINVGGDWTIGDSAVGNRISNPGTCSLSHTLQIGNAIEQLGRFILAGSGTINLAGSASRLSFANSSGETWAGGATLLVTNWNGSPSGGGAEQLRFGTGQSGLTAAQLSQIQFSIGTAFYAAKILNTGEVVPDLPTSPNVAFSLQGNNLVLTWPQGWTLQSATNILGPYSDVPEATSPHTVDMSVYQQRFFRLRQSAQ